MARLYIYIRHLFAIYWPAVMLGLVTRLGELLVGGGERHKYQAALLFTAIERPRRSFLIAAQRSAPAIFGLLAIRHSACSRLRFR